MERDSAAEHDLALAIERRTRRLLWWAATCVVSFVIGYCGRWIPEPWLIVSVVSIPVFIVSLFMVVGTNARLQRDVRRRDAAPLADALAAPVLYLRSFADDQASARLLGELTEEEHLAKVLASIGPLVAIGRPGEFRPELGAGRMYVSDQDWQAVVEGHIRAARLVVIRTGFSEGLRWEIQQAVRLVSPERLVIVVDSAKEMRECLEQIRIVHPQVRGSVRLGWRSIGSVRAFLIFDERWQVSRLKLRRSACSKRQNGSVVGPRFSRTLRPLFDRLNVAWTKPPRDWAKVTVALCIAGIILVLLVSGAMS